RRDPLAHADGVGKLDAALARESGFVIEEVHLGRSAGLEEVDHPFRSGSEVRQLRQTALRSGRGTPRPVAAEQGTQSQRSQPNARTSEEEPAIDLLCQS